MKNKALIRFNFDVHLYTAVCPFCKWNTAANSLNGIIDLAESHPCTAIPKRKPRKKKLSDKQRALNAFYNHEEIEE